ISLVRTLTTRARLRTRSGACRPRAAMIRSRRAIFSTLQGTDPREDHGWPARDVSEDNGRTAPERRVVRLSLDGTLHDALDDALLGHRIQDDDRQHRHHRRGEEDLLLRRVRRHAPRQTAL